MAQATASEGVVDSGTNKKYTYIEKETELTPEHLTLLQELQQYKKDILSKKIEWKIHTIEDRWKIEAMDTESIINNALNSSEEKDSADTLATDSTNPSNPSNQTNIDNDNDNDNDKNNTNETKTETKESEPTEADPTQDTPATDTTNNNDNNNENNNETNNDDNSEKTGKRTSLFGRNKKNKKDKNNNGNNNNKENDEILDENGNPIDKNAPPGNLEATNELATEELYKYFKDYCTDETLIRHLTGADYQIEKSKQALLRTVEWRVLSKIDSIVPQQFQNVLDCKAVYCLNKFDKDGHPICYFKILNRALDDPWDFVKAAVFTVEKCLRFCDNKGLYQCVWVIDLEHLKYGTMPPIAVMREIAHVLHYYYPERLKCAYIVHAALVFRMVWGLVSSLLTENTKSKIKFISWNDSKKYKTYQEQMDKESLESYYGGNDDTVYSYDWELNVAKKNKYYRNLKDNTKLIE